MNVRIRMTDTQTGEITKDKGNTIFNNGKNQLNNFSFIHNQQNPD